MFRTSRRPFAPAPSFRVLIALAAVLLLTSCFEEPVAERMGVTFQPDGTFTLRVETAISDPGKADNPALRRRLDELRRAFEQGYDPWARRFELLAPDFERIVQEREEGTLVRIERTARSSDHEALRRFLADAGVTALLRLDDREATFEIIPAGSLRASRSQRDRVHELLSTWSDAVARTYAATQDLYAYLADHPERAAACLSAVFAEALSTADQRPGRELTDADQPLVDTLRQARKDVVAIFEVPADEAYSLNELSHLVYDPFPARLTVEVPSEPLAVEGFATGPDGALVVSGLGLYEALETLDGVWAQPDPLVTYVAAARGVSDAGLTLESLAGEPRTAAAPPPDEVRTALEERLRPAPLYRVVFRFTAGEDDEEEAPLEAAAAPSSAS